MASWDEREEEGEMEESSEVATGVSGERGVRFKAYSSLVHPYLKSMLVPGYFRRHLSQPSFAINFSWVSTAMDPETFVDPHLPLADLIVLDNLLGDIEARTGSRDVSQQKRRQGSNGTTAAVTSIEAANGNACEAQNENGNVNGISCKCCCHYICHPESLLTAQSKT